VLLFFTYQTTDIPLLSTLYEPLSKQLISVLGYLAGMHERDARARTDPEGLLRRSGTNTVERRALARGSYCVIGDPDTVAQELSRLHAVGFDGLALNFVDYLAELPYFAEAALPRLERLGLRTTPAH